MIGQNADALIKTFHLDSGVIEVKLWNGVLESMTQAIKDRDFAKVKTLNDRVPILPKDVYMPHLKKALASGFSLMELHRYPYLISSLL